MRAHLLPFLVLTTTISAQMNPSRTLTDLRDTGEAERWYTVLDGVMGGRSSGSLAVADGRTTSQTPVTPSSRPPMTSASPIGDSKR